MHKELQERILGQSTERGSLPKRDCDPAQAIWVPLFSACRASAGLTKSERSCHGSHSTRSQNGKSPGPAAPNQLLQDRVMGRISFHVPALDCFQRIVQVMSKSKNKTVIAINCCEGKGLTVVQLGKQLYFEESPKSAFWAGIISSGSINATLYVRSIYIPFVPETPDMAPYVESYAGSSSTTGWNRSPQGQRGNPKSKTKQWISGSENIWLSCETQETVVPAHEWPRLQVVNPCRFHPDSLPGICAGCGCISWYLMDMHEPRPCIHCVILVRP